jgi:hypothetical protein
VTTPSETIADVETATSGIADAISYGPAGNPDVVVDWKSDVSPEPALVEHYRYRAQVRSYLASTGAKQGLIVFVTTGRLSVPPVT